MMTVFSCDSQETAIMAQHELLVLTQYSRFTNSRSLSSPQALALETLWIFSIVSRCDSFEGKGRKMPRMEIKIVRQAPRRTHGLAIPRTHCLRCTDRCDGFQQRPGQSGQTDPPLQRCCCPRPRHLHGGGVLCHKEVRLHWPPMPVASPTLRTRQLTCRGAHEQRRIIGGIVNPYDIQPHGGAFLIVQQMPPPKPDEAGLPTDVPLHVRCHLGHGAPGRDHGAVDRTPPAFARGGWRSTPQLDVDA